mmetsp:Transcript_17860/g.24884  ORF Transcript_17860/g.24884 Transcript_17860/m.24884 type:complete len:216 (+) Transcript_17860:430-1077(+)
MSSPLVEWLALSGPDKNGCTRGSHDVLLIDVESIDWALNFRVSQAHLFSQASLVPHFDRQVRGGTVNELTIDLNSLDRTFVSSEFANSASIHPGPDMNQTIFTSGVHTLSIHSHGIDTSSVVIGNGVQNLASLFVPDSQGLVKGHSEELSELWVGVDSSNHISVASKSGWEGSDGDDLVTFFDAVWGRSILLVKWNRRWGFYSRVFVISVWVLVG